MFDYNSIMALKEIVGGQEDEQLVENYYKGSALNPGAIGSDGGKKQIAQPNAKVEAKIGEKYVPKQKRPKQQEQKQETNKATTKKKIDQKHEIWSEQEVKQLPINLQDPRKQPQFETLYRQKVGTEDVYLGLSGVDPSSNHCNQILYKIQLPETQTKQIQIDLNEKQMVLQTNKFYLAQHFQYPVDYKRSKAEYVSDKSMLKLILPVIRSDDF